MKFSTFEHLVELCIQHWKFYLHRATYNSIRYIETSLHLSHFTLISLSGYFQNREIFNKIFFFPSYYMPQYGRKIHAENKY